VRAGLLFTCLFNRGYGMRIRHDRAPLTDCLALAAGQVRPSVGRPLQLVSTSFVLDQGWRSQWDMRNWRL
jgi:hypothetical protein